LTYLASARKTTVVLKMERILVPLALTLSFKN
jgi:hypothetical protein